MRKLVVTLIALAGCGPADMPCTSMAMPSDLAQKAQLVRLDVYEGVVHCDGATVQTGAPPPTLSKAAGAGQPIRLDIPSGPHTLLLSAFSDSVGNQLLATACTETDLNAGASVCFNLTLVEIPDLALNPDSRATCSASPDNCSVGQYCAVDGQCAPGCKDANDCMGGSAAKLCDTGAHRCVECLGPADCMAGKKCSPSGSCVMGCDVAAGSNCPGAQMCCSSLCTDITSDISSCGACGRACNSANVATPGCASNLCAPVCTSGFGDCHHPVAPSADDGCETSFHDVANCGGCSNACSLPHATPKCPTGTCQIMACETGATNYFDCNSMPIDGCECPGVDKMDNMKGCCGPGMCQVQHLDGYAHPFYECVALGTYTLAVATDAARAYAPTAAPADIFAGSMGTVSAVCYQNPNKSETISWAYADTTGLAVGHTRRNTVPAGPGLAPNCIAAMATDLSWN